MKTIESSQTIREQRFDQYLAMLSEAVDHPDRAKALRDYCTGLLLPLERKSIEPIAAQVAPTKTKAKHQSLQQFIADAPWRDAAVLRVTRQYALPAFQRCGGVEATIIDDTGHPKKGNHSVGVARQYCGQLGKVDNCQVAISLSLVNQWISLPVAYDLFLPEEWASDRERRQKAGVPDEIKFRTKPNIALNQIEWAVRTGLELGVIGADAAYGDATDFRDGLTALGLLYCVGIRETTTVWEEGQGPLPPKEYSGRGRKPSLLRRDEQHQPATVKELAQGLPEESFRKVTWREGARGKLSSRFAAVRVRPAHLDYLRSAPRAEEWLLIEWPEGESEPTQYWLSTLSPRTLIKRLVYFAKLRWRIERDYEDLKQETGLGHYEGRKWRGFHHHATMCIAVYAFLVAERGLFPPSEVGSQSGLEEFAIPRSQRSSKSSGATGTTQSNFNCNAAQRVEHHERSASSALPQLSTKKQRWDRSVLTGFPAIT
jgi:SRSO17 transposase